jgi:Putative peptidoglycan binding domain
LRSKDQASTLAFDPLRQRLSPEVRSGSDPASGILDLQRLAGNQATTKLIASLRQRHPGESRPPQIGLQRFAGNRASSRSLAPLAERPIGTSMQAAGAAVAPVALDDTPQVGGITVSRDLAVAPTNPDATADLTDQQVADAVKYNSFRFKDPYSLANIRDIVGVERFPAVSDEDLARAVATYQAQFGLTPDGKAGPDTTARLSRELRAEGSADDATHLEEDNFVTWSDINGPAFNLPGAPGDANGFATFFQWDVNFSTSLRNGWIVQEITNTWVNNDAAGNAIPAGAPTPHYWEAWWVDGSGHVLVPLAISADRKRATASGAPLIASDLWRRDANANTTGADGGPTLYNQDLAWSVCDRRCARRGCPSLQRSGSERRRPRPGGSVPGGRRTMGRCRGAALARPKLIVPESRSLT